MAVEESIWGLLGWAAGTGVLSLAGAYALFQKLGERWLDHKFDERLQNLKHQHDQEIRRLQLTINALLDGKVKYQDHEFDVLPGVWKRLQEANDKLAIVVNPSQFVSKINELDEIELNLFLAGSRLTALDQKAVNEASDKTELYNKIIEQYRINDAAKALYEFDRYARENVIFMPEEIAGQVTKAEEILRHARVDKQVGLEAKDFRMQYDGYKKLKDDFTPLKDEIGAQIREYLLSLGSSKSGNRK